MMMRTTQYKNVNTLTYSDFGSPEGFPLLIQHGMIASIRDASRLFGRLAQAGRRVISLARPGYGESSPYKMRDIGEWGEIVSSLVDDLGLEAFDVLGISSGAPYAYAIGYALPERVRDIYILSGTPALYDEAVRAIWPYPSNQNATLEEMQKLAYELFFAHLPPADLQKDDIRDSMQNHCFGIAQDLRLRVRDWGFRLEDVQPKVLMRHSRADESVPFAAAGLTARLLPHCRLEVRGGDPHFSQEVLDEFIETILQASRLRKS